MKEESGQICSQCGLTMRKSRINEHVCNVIKNDVLSPGSNYVTYTKPLPYTADYLRSISPSIAKRLCYENHWYLDNFFPLFSVDLKWRHFHDVYAEFGNPSGREGMLEILNDLKALGEPAETLLHEKIKFIGENGREFFANKDLTTPKSQDFIVNEGEDDNTISVSLVPRGRNVQQDGDQVMDDLEEDDDQVVAPDDQEDEDFSTLLEYQKYTKGKIFKHNPHEYPDHLKRSANRCLNPHLLSPLEIRQYTGMSVGKFWKLVDIFGNAQAIRSRTKRYKLSLASFTLLHRKATINHVDTFIVMLDPHSLSYFGILLKRVYAEM